MNKLIYMIVILFFFVLAIMFIKTFIDLKTFPKNTFILNEEVILPTDRALEHFSGGLKIQTISNPIYNETDFEKFDEFIEYLKSTYPLIFSKCVVTFINNYNIIIKLNGEILNQSIEIDFKELEEDLIEMRHIHDDEELIIEIL